MARRIKLSKFVTPNVNYITLGAIRVRVEASEAEDMDNRIFVWRRDPINPHTGDTLDTFFTIASPVDLEEYPPEEPDPEKAYPFFRRNWLELDFRAVADANEAWVKFVELTCVLITALNLLENLTLEAEVWVGAPPGEASSQGA